MNLHLGVHENGSNKCHDLEKSKKRFSNLRCSDISLQCLRWHTKKNLLLSWFQPSFASKSIFLSHLRSDVRGCKERIALRLRPTNEWQRKNPAKMNAGCCYGLFYQRLDSSYISIKPKPGCPIAKDDQYIWCENLLNDGCTIWNVLLLTIITYLEAWSINGGKKRLAVENWTPNQNPNGPWIL